MATTINYAYWLAPNHQKQPCHFGWTRSESVGPSASSYDLTTYGTLQYRPRTLAELHFHAELSTRLKSLVSNTFVGMKYQTAEVALYARILPCGECRSVIRCCKKAASGDFPHMLFYGPSGAGKKTRIAGTLRELFGPGAEKVCVATR